jgi:hypothetical protein
MNFFDWLNQNNCQLNFTISERNFWHTELRGPIKLFDNHNKNYINVRSWGFNKINSIKSLISILNHRDLFYTNQQKKTVIFFDRIVTTGERIYPPRLFFPDLKEETNKLAKQKWESAGCPAGMDEKFWFEAENELVDKLTKF